MSDVEDFGFFEEEPEEEEKEVDPGTLAFLDQRQQAFEDKRGLFYKAYGFDHKCRCADDYAEGNTTEVAKCFVQMTDDSLARCAEATYEIGMLTLYLNEMVKMVADLAKLIEDLGHGDDLEQFFLEEMDDIEEVEKPKSQQELQQEGEPEVVEDDEPDSDK